ncbi:hypothetical protein G7077_12140 [Sphingomonas piscis]|uniref:Spermidine synthase n=1 Tax=Sphingomonas piscis TaxID=2714943 RepID=A0A6G7YS25_9SPHN|nr:fused MFS/spermidine synthase [Sphingomonas piscis]QIK79543.1 hypothetical protein G7077_12140 [Sphingomonas piscis]
MATAALPATAPLVSVRWKFVATIFFGSFLLFLVQPMIARMALPRLGGAPTVWNSAMLVYQALLLLGYSYAHWLTRQSPSKQRLIHLLAFAIAGVMLPIGLISGTPGASANSFLWVPWLLIMSIGPLFFVVSAQAPIIQSWYAKCGLGDPYPLYAASNFGSFAGLLAYPFVVEPLLSVANQRMLWSAGYVLLALLCGYCSFHLPKARTDGAVEAVPPARSKMIRWALQAAVPSGLVLSTTLQLTTDIVAVPLLWVLPLGLYLLSFSIAFAASRGVADVMGRAAPFTLLITACAAMANAMDYALPIAGLILLNLLAVSVALHSALYDQRPAASQLTYFYLAMSAGGVAGGIFCALLAPLLFDSTYENVVLLTAAAFLLKNEPLWEKVGRYWQRQSRGRLFAIAAGILLLSALGPIFSAAGHRNLGFTYLLIAIGVATVGNRLLFATTATALLLFMGGWEKIALSAQPGMMTRSYFGIYSIHTSQPGRRSLAHGTTMHGIQLTGSPQREVTPTSYYAPRSGIGLAMRSTERLFGPGARIGVVGLGTGTLACYATAKQSWTFYEIDPAVADIARDPKRFTFLSRCMPNARIEIGDARLTLGRSRRGSADLLTIDAFSSDSVPMHLLTREAFQAYADHLRSGGLLMVHISNRYLELEPVIAGAAKDGGWSAMARKYYPTDAEKDHAASASLWIALSRDPETVRRLVEGSGEEWRLLNEKTGFQPWTDDRGSLLGLIHWGG